MPCSNPQSSDCVLYAGNDLKTQEVDLTCLPTLTKVLEKLDGTLDVVNKSIDISKLKSNLKIDPTKATIAEYLQAVVSLLDSVKTDLQALKTNQTQDLLAVPVQIDLSCFGNSCDDNGTTTLLTVLNTFARAICRQNESSESSTGFYQP